MNVLHHTIPAKIIEFNFHNFHVKDIDDCNATAYEEPPCEDPGICIDKVDGYECDCPRHYSGTRCQYFHICKYEATFIS